MHDVIVNMPSYYLSSNLKFGIILYYIISIEFKWKSNSYFSHWSEFNYSYLPTEEKLDILVANVLDFLAVRHFKQGTETSGLRPGNWSVPTCVFVVLYICLLLYVILYDLILTVIMKPSLLDTLIQLQQVRNQFSRKI